MKNFVFKTITTVLSSKQQHLWPSAEDTTSQYSTWLHLPGFVVSTPTGCRLNSVGVAFGWLNWIKLLNEQNIAEQPNKTKQAENKIAIYFCTIVCRGLKKTTMIWFHTKETAAANGKCSFLYGWNEWIEVKWSDGKIEFS